MGFVGRSYHGVFTSAGVGGRRKKYVIWDLRYKLGFGEAKKGRKVMRGRWKPEKRNTVKVIVTMMFVMIYRIDICIIVYVLFG